jgi:hypothetical protein
MALTLVPLFPIQKPVKEPTVSPTLSIYKDFVTPYSVLKGGHRCLFVPGKGFRWIALPATNIPEKPDPVLL